MTENNLTPEESLTLNNPEPANQPAPANPVINTFDHLEENLIVADLIAQPPPLMTIGELFRSKREEKGLNLKTISFQTKIHIGLLEHLEKNELAKLPSKTYVRGFVKSTAKILGIKQEVALDALEATYNRDKKEIKPPAQNVEMRNEAARNTLSVITTTQLEAVKNVTASSSLFLLKAAGIIFILAIVGINLKNILSKSPEENLKLPKVLSTTNQRTKSPAKINTIKAPPVAEDPSSATPIQVNIIQDKKDVFQKSEIVINDLKLKNISLGEKQFIEDNSVTGEKLDEIFPPKYRVNPTKGVENVFINAVEGDSWLTYKVDDKEIKKYVLRQGRTVFLRGEKVRLFLGNTKTIKVFYNNKLLGFNTKETVKNLVFPEELKTKYMSPLFVFQKDGSVLTSDEFIKSNQSPNASPTGAKPIETPATAPVIKSL